MKIRTPDRRLRVFVSSTIGELETERAAARAAIEQLRMTPVMFESGARPHPAQDVYQAYLEQSEVFVGIYWQRYGWVGPGMTVSGLEDEFRRSGRLPRLLYLKRPAPAMEPGLRAMLDAVRSDGGVAYKAFADAGELRELLLNDLATLVSERFGGTGQAPERAAVPAPVTGLVGRDHDLSEVVRLLDAEDHRLVVLTGAGGVGKTRLALAVIEGSRPHWPDGVAFIDLSAVDDAQAVPEAIASALGFVGQGREMPLDTLRRRLADQQMLLTLDNFEHVVEAAPVVAGLLQQAPRLHVLVTSRVRLRVRGEQEWRVDPLGLPPPASAASPVLAETLAAVAGAPSVQLFVERVRDVRPGYELTSDDAPAVAELCRRLDGLPLALELAAAWRRLLSPAQMLERLDERLSRPGSLTDLPGRQQTMNATLEWSYELLPASARQLLARLSVFAAPFTADGAGAVSGGDAPGGDALGATEDLATLLDHSMIGPAVRPDGEPGFRMLNVIRRFARQQLETPDETLARLDGYVLGILEQAGTQHGSQARALRRLDSEQPNFQVVLRWRAGQHRAAGRLLRRIGDVWVWLLVRGLLRDGTELRRQVDSWPVTELPSERDQLAWQWLTMQGLIDDGRFAQAGALIEEILPATRRLAEPSRVGLTLMLRALTRPYTADSPARAEYEEALAVTRSSGDLIILGYVLSHFGLFLSAGGDTARARGLHEEMLGTARSLGDDNQRAEAHYDLAMDALSEGDADAALPHLVVAARHYIGIDHRDGLARCLGALTAVAFQRQQSQLAARLIGATETARTIGLTPWPVTTEVERRVSERVRAALPETEFTAQVAAGRAQTAEAALGEALPVLGG